MKKYLFLYTCIFFLMGNFQTFAQTVIGDDSPEVVEAAIDGSAELKIFSSSNDKGVLFSVLTNANMNGIMDPALGLLIFNSTQNRYMFHTSEGWIPFSYIESVSTNSKIGIYEGETKFYDVSNVLIFLDNTNSWKQITIGTGIITP